MGTSFYTIKTVITGKIIMDNIGYYNRNAAEYISDTFEADMAEIRRVFMIYLPARGTVLDAGCGPGRDAKAFIEAGYDVYAIDASEALVDHCRTIIGNRVELVSFRDYSTDMKFDGIWACASLLHLEHEELISVINRFAGYLKTGGVFFMSFKYGTGDYIKEGRYFNCHTEDSINSLLSGVSSLEVLENFITGDVRPGRADERWINVIARKRFL